MTQPVRLAPGVWRIPTFTADLVNSFAFEEPDGGITLVDTGLKGSGPKGIVAGLAAMGRQPQEVRRILLTHAHYDHAGGLARVAAHTGAPVAIHDDDATYARTGKPPKLDPGPLANRLFNLVRTGFAAAEVQSTFREGDLLDVAGGLRVLHTPGHTPGHCSFLHEPSGVLITGDSLFNFFDRMSYSFSFFCSNVLLSRQTADRLGDVDYEICAFTHGPEIRSGAREKVRDFLRRHTRS
jgi:glyoxylase-like metal-dependent hydrolase (beta-lactamase superfamily II)